MESLFTTFVLLLFCHFLADFPLQGDYMAKAKNPKLSSKEVWPIVLFGHCMIHMGFVLVITHSLVLAFVQLFTHFVIDYAKCMGKFGFAKDQLLHALVLLGIAIASQCRFGASFCAYF